MTATAGPVGVGIIDPFHPRILETIRAALPAEWTMTVAGGRSKAEQESAVADAEIVLVMATPMPASLIAAARKLRFIQKLGAGVDRIDTDACTARGIGLARLQAGNAIPVAEHTLTLMLSAYRRLPLLDRQTRAGYWDKEDSRGVNLHLHGRRVGLVGFGAIGRQVARLLSGFGCEIIYFDPIRADAAVERDLGVSYCELDELIASSDVISLHLPLMKETAGLIDARRIASMKPDALLVNAARGGLVDEAALAEALRERRIFGAALDAFSQEPPLGNPLLELDNTIVTPHCAGATLNNFAGIVERAVANCHRTLRGEPLPDGDTVLAPALPA